MTLKPFLRWLPSAIVIAVILYATLFPDPAGADMLPLVPHIDKLIHAIMFGGLAGALAFDYERTGSRQRPEPRVMLICCCIALAFGGAIELLQGVMDLGRGADLWDFAADAAGVAVAYFTAPPAIKAVLSHRRITS